MDWASYRLPLTQTQSLADHFTHLRVTCNFITEGQQHMDNACAKLKGHYIFGKWSKCAFLPLYSVALSLLRHSWCHHTLKTLWYVTVTISCFVTFIQFTFLMKYMLVVRSNVWWIFKSDLLSQKLSNLKTWPLSDVIKSQTFSFKRI